MIITWNTNPEIIRIGEIGLRYYSILFAMGIVIVFLISERIFRRELLDLSTLRSISGYIIVGLLTGARLGHCLFYDFSYYSHHIFEIFLPFKFSGGTFLITGFQGLSSHGGIIGILAATIVWKIRNSKTAIIGILDVISISAPLCGALIRIGNFMNSEIIGKTTANDWGVIFSRIDAIPRHPAQLYEACAYTVIFVIMTATYRKTNLLSCTGRMSGLLFVLVFSARIIIDFFKKDQSTFEASLPINMGQLLSIPFIVLGIILLAQKNLFKNKA